MLREQKERNFSQQTLQPLSWHKERIKEMANNIRWFTGELGVDILGEDFYRQVFQIDKQEPSDKKAIQHTSCEAVSLMRAAETGDLYFGGGRFPALYDIKPTGLMPFLVKLGYVRDDDGVLTLWISESDTKPHFASLTVVHPNELFEAKITRYFTGYNLSNSLNIEYVPFRSDGITSADNHSLKMNLDMN